MKIKGAEELLKRRCLSLIEYLKDKFSYRVCLSPWHVHCRTDSQGKGHGRCFLRNCFCAKHRGGLLNSTFYIHTLYVLSNILYIIFRI